MTNVMVPIDPDKKDDIYYRYKMPAIQSKVESSGNGIKTVIPNIHEVCSALNRPEEVLLKFFQFELGAQSTSSAKDDKHFLMGKHTEDRLLDLVYSFVKKFVLCGNCRNPETAINLNAKRKTEQVSMTCAACGKTSKMDTTHRAYSLLCQYYIKHPDEAKSGKGTAEARKKQQADEPAAASAGESPAPTPAPAAAAVEEGKTKKEKAAKSDLKDERANPMELFAAQMKDAEAVSAAAADADAAKDAGAAFHVTHTAMERLIAAVVRLMSDYNLTEEFGCRIILPTIFNLHAKQPLAAIKVYAPLLRRFSTVAELFYRQETFDEKTLSTLLDREAKIQRFLIVDCATCVARSKDAVVPPAERMAVLMFLLFVEGIVKDTSILAFTTNEKDIPGVEPELGKQMKANTAAVVEWLQIQKEAEARAEAKAKAKAEAEAAEAAQAKADAEAKAEAKAEAAAAAAAAQESAE